MACHAERIACQMGLPDEEIERIRVAASIHDIGKLFVPHSILMRPGRLSPEEYSLVKRHAEQGADLARELGDPDVTAIVRHHHERVDGGGYPDGLAGDEIPLGARIIAVADTFDAITSERPYRRAASRKSAMDVLSEVAGSQLDATVVNAFVDYYSGRRSIAGAAAFATVPQRVVSWIAATPAGVGASAAPIAQGVCAASAVAVAGICIGGVPALSGDSDGDKRARPAGQVSHVERNGGDAKAAEDGTGADRRSGADRRVAVGGPRAQRNDVDGRGPGGGGAPGGSGGPTPTTTAPTGGGPMDRVAEAPGSVAPDAPVSPPSLPIQPPTVLDPVVDTVDKVLAPAPQPVQDVTQPVKDLLGQTGLTSPAP